MAVHLCQWPNGEFSVVSAVNRADVIELLDEWGTRGKPNSQEWTRARSTFSYSARAMSNSPKSANTHTRSLWRSATPCRMEPFGSAESDGEEQ